MVLAHNEPPNRIPQPIFFFPSNLQRQVYVIFINDLHLKFPHPLLAPITASVPLIFFSSNSKQFLLHRRFPISFITF